MTKPLSPSHIKAIAQYPWGNQPLGSSNHARWLGRKVINQINSKLQLPYIVEQIKQNKEIVIDLKNDLSDFPECEQYVRGWLENCGWAVKIKYNSEISTCRTTIYLKEKI